MDDFSLTHIPPQDLDCEDSIISTCLIQSGETIKFIEQLKPLHFYRTANQKIFKAFVEMCEKGIPTDLHLTAGYLRDIGILESVGGAGGLSKLTDHPIVSSIDAYAKRVRDKFTLRNLIETTHVIQKDCYKDEDPEETLDKAQSLINSIEPGIIKQPAVKYADILDSVMDNLEETQKTKGAVSGIPTGFVELDERLGGLQKSDYIILAARPSMGKTALMLNIARNIAKYEGKPSLVFSMEMSKEQLLLRELCSSARIDSQRVRNGLLSKTDWNKIAYAAGKAADWPVYIDDAEGMHYMDMRRRARKFASQHDIGAIFIDYLQLMKGDADQNREREISSISGSVKGMAKELKVPVVALSQLNRKVEERSDKRPGLADLRDSGSLEQDSDVVLFIYRDEVYNSDKNNPNKGIADIICAKQRNGPIGIDQLTWLSTYTTFENKVRTGGYQ